MNFSTMFANEEAGEYWPELQAEIDRWNQVLSDDPGMLNQLIFGYMEAADLRRQLAEAQANERIALDALDMAIAERDEAYKELDAAQAHLANVAVLPPPRCGDRGFAGHSACSLPAGHDGPHEYRTFMYDHDERVRRLSSHA